MIVLYVYKKLNLTERIYIYMLDILYDDGVV